MRFNSYSQVPSVVPSHRDRDIPSNLITFHHHLPKPADTQAEMVSQDVLPKLCSLLASGSEAVRRASVALLWILSQHPHNQVGELILPHVLRYRMIPLPTLRANTTISSAIPGKHTKSD